MEPELVKSISNQEFAFQMLTTVWELVNQAMEENPDHISVSWFIGILSALIPVISPEQSDAIQELAQFGSNLIEGDRMDDGIVIFSNIVSLIGGNNPQILEFCASLVLEHLLDDIEKNQQNSLIDLCKSIIGHIYDSEVLANILDSVVNLLVTNTDSIHMRLTITSILSNIASKIPEALPNYTRRINESNMIFYFFASRALNNEGMIYFIRALIEDLLENDPENFRVKIYSTGLIKCGLGLVCSTEQQEKKFEILDMLLDISQRVVDSSKEPIELSKDNFDTLSQLCDEPRKVVIDQIFRLRQLPINAVPISQQ